MAREARSLTNKVAVVTGGGRGIGAATAALLINNGAKVAIGDLDEALAKETASKLGRNAIGLQLDVTDHAGFTAFLDQVERELGPLDILVNNAGIMPINRIEDETERTTYAQIAVNLHAVIHGSREAVKRMKPRGTGHIVNISSAAGRIPVGGGATYTATKHGVSGFSNALHFEFKGDGTPISVTAVHPAIVRTDLSKGLKDNKGGAKPVQPEDVAEGVVDALKFPRPDVYVPKQLGTSIRVGGLIPRRTGEWLNKVLGGERALLDAIDSPERTDYETRVAASSPAADREHGGTA